MYLYGRQASGQPLSELPGGAQLHGEVTAADPRTNAQCRATEHRIRPIVEPPRTELIAIPARYLADPSRPKFLQRAAFAAYTQLKAAAEASGIAPALLRIVSAYRGIAHQRRLWEDALRRYGSPEIARHWVAPPGGSPHHTGRAIDFTLGTWNRSDNIAALRATPAYRWLVCNAARFGFHPYAREPWHWEYSPHGTRPTLSGAFATDALGAFGESHSLAPEDVASEMVGRPFTLSGPFMLGSAAVPKGAAVQPTSWPNSLDNVPVQSGANTGIVPKVLLLPVNATVPGIVPYTIGIAAQAAAVTRRSAAVGNWVTKGANAGTSGNPKFKAELKRLEDLRDTSRRVLNRFLIIESMYNRFDSDIRQWVDFYNTQFGFTGARALDPNIVKAMIFQETRMGTSGRHLEVPPSHPVKTRFNLMQVIDSSAAALLIMIQEMQPGLMKTRHLTTLQSELAPLQAELNRLRKLTKRNATQEARLKALKTLGKRSWEDWIWAYRAKGQSDGFADAVTDFFAAVTPHRNEDYAFWIRAGVRWLCEKRGGAADWPDSVRAYNGSGQGASDYRDAVIARVTDAAAAQRAGTPFVITN